MQIKLKVIGLSLAISALMNASPASADVHCSYTVSTVAIDQEGNVNVAFQNNGVTYVWYVCNVQGTVTVGNPANMNTNVTSGMCSALYAQLLTARSSGQSVSLWMQTPTSCSSAGGLPDPWTWFGGNKYPYNFAF